MVYAEFEKKTGGKTLEEIVREGRKKTMEMLESQGVAAVALYISEILMKSIESERLKEAKS